MTFPPRKSALTAAIIGLCWLLHFWTHQRQGSLQEMLWACNVATLLIAAGILFSHRPSFTVGTLWLTAGTPLWLLDLCSTGGLLWTSVLTHLLVLGLALRHTKELKLHPDGWWMAAVAGAFLQQICRWFTHWRFNVNMSWGVYPSLRKVFSHYSSYWIFTFITLTIAYIILQRFIDTYLSKRAAHEPNASGG